MTFSIWNENGRVVGFSARTLEKDAPVAKYVNTPETPVFKKGNLLYALPFARPEMRNMNMAILCEGQLDVIAMHRAGFPCAVAPQGTGFTVEQARILKRSTQKILLGFDSDNAGQKAIMRAIELILPLDMEIGVIRFPGGKDPDELFKNEGSQAIAEAVRNAENWLTFFAEAMRIKYDLNSVNGRSQAAAEYLNLIKLVDNAVTRELYLQHGAEMFNLSSQAMNAELAKIERFESRRQSGTAVDEDKLEQQKALIVYQEKAIELYKQYFQRNLKPLEEKLTALKKKPSLSEEEKHSIVQLEKAIELHNKKYPCQAYA